MTIEDEASHQSLVPKMRARVGERAVPIVQNKIARKMAGFLINQKKSSQKRFCDVKVLHKSKTRCTIYQAHLPSASATVPKIKPPMKYPTMKKLSQMAKGRN